MISTSVPSQNCMQEHFPQGQGKKQSTDDGGKLQKVFDVTSLGRSRSVDRLQSKSSSKKRKLSKVSKHTLEDPNRSFTGTQNGSATTCTSKGGAVTGYSNFRTNSMCSVDSDSGAGSSASTSKMNTRIGSQGSGETVSKGYSSGESSKSSRRKDAGSDKTKEGSRFSSKIISRVLSWSDLGSPRLKNRTPSNKGKDANLDSGGGSRKNSGRPSGGLNSKEKQQERMNNSHISADGGGREKRAPSPVVIYRDDDPSYVHNCLQLFLVMDVFGSKEEYFKMVFRSSMVCYGKPGELPMLVVVSNVRAYLFRVVAPERY